MMGFIFGLALILVIVWFGDVMFDLNFGYLTYGLMVLIFVLVSVFGNDDDTTIVVEQPVAEKEVVILDDREQIKQDLKDIKQGFKDIKQGLIQLSESGSTEKGATELIETTIEVTNELVDDATTTSDEPKASEDTTSTETKTGVSNVGLWFVTICVFVFGVLMFESFWISVAISTVFFITFMDSSITVSQTPNGEAKRVESWLYDSRPTEYINNKVRSRTPVYLYKNGGETVASTSPNPNVTEWENAKVYSDITLKHHTTGQLYACTKTKICYPIQSND